MTGYVRIEGLKETQTALRQLKDSTAKGVLRRIGKKRLKPVADDYRESVRKRSGALAKSVTVGTRLTRTQKRKHRKPDPHDVEVYAGPDARPQAITEEFGTPDQAPQRVLTRAWEANRRGLVAGLRDDLMAEITKTAARAAKRAAKKAGR